MRGIRLTGTRRGRPGREPRPQAPLGAAARAVAQRTPETMAVVRHRAQPAAVAIARLATTAVFAYLMALLLPGSPRSVLAPLTALLVAQVTLSQTVRSAIERVTAVVVVVLVAVGLSALVGFTWWSLGLTIVVALAIGYALRLGDTVLEVPISAMLILSTGTGGGAAATSRIVETLVGAAAGLLSGLVFTRPRLQPATEAIAELCRRMAGLLTEMAGGLTDAAVAGRSGDWLAEARRLDDVIQRVDEALRQAEESVRLNPRAPRLSDVPVGLRRQLETLEHAAITVRGVARSLADIVNLGEDSSPVGDEEIRLRLGATLSELAAALGDYSRLAVVTNPADSELTDADLQHHLTAAGERQDQLSELLGVDPAAQPVGWPLRGELVSHLDRLRTELTAGASEASPAPRQQRLRESVHQALRRIGRPPQ